MKRALLLLLTLVATIGTGCSAPGATIAEKRQFMMEMRDDAMYTLETYKPGARDRAEGAAGYAVFSTVGMHFIFVGGGGGRGVVTNNDTGETTFMRMGQADVGLGLGVRDFRAVFVFHDEAAMNEFIWSGWEFGGDADATAQASGDGVSATAAGTMMNGIEVYQFTETGLNASATVGGTKYWLDNELNE